MSEPNLPSDALIVCYVCDGGFLPKVMTLYPLATDERPCLQTLCPACLADVILDDNYPKELRPPSTGGQR